MNPSIASDLEAFICPELSINKSMVYALGKALQMDATKNSLQLQDEKGDKSWTIHIQEVIKNLSTQDVSNKVFYINQKGLVVKSDQVFTSLKNKNYTEQDLLKQLEDGHSIIQAWCIKEDGSWKFVARLQEPKRDKEVSTEGSYSRPQITPASSSSSSRAPLVQEQEQVVTEEYLSSLLSIQNEAVEVSGGTAPRKAKDNNIKMHGSIKDVYFTRGTELCPRYTGFLRAALEGQGVTLGKSGESYTYEELEKFVVSFKEKMCEVLVVHSPNQYVSKKRVYLVSKIGQDHKPHIWFVGFSTKGDPFVLK
jgi:hypothetical protein